MSACKQRHENRKVERTRRRRSWFNPKSAIQNPKSVAAALAAAAVIAAGTQAYASPVRYDNPVHGDPGHFHWPIEGDFQHLEMTLPASGQPGASGSASSLGHGTFGQYGALGGNVFFQAGGYGDYYAVGAEAGEQLPLAGFAWSQSGYSYSPWGGSLLLEGIPTYLSLAFDPYGADGTTCTIGGPDCHYGWIGVVRTGPALDTFAWGYETLANTPIEAGIPEPGTLALLALGAAAVTRRRR